MRGNNKRQRKNSDESTEISIKMKKKISVWLAVAIVLLFGLATFMTTYTVMSSVSQAKEAGSGTTGQSTAKPIDPVYTGDETKNEYSDFVEKLADKIAEVDEIYRALYIDELNDDELIDYTVAGYVAGTGDKYGAYYNAEEFADFTSDLKGEFAGIGVNVIYNADYKVIEVINVIENSPAERAGILPGDLIITAGEDKESVVDLGYYPAIDKIRGEIGTYATFTVARGENYEEEIEFSVIRENVTSVTVMHHVYEPDPTIGIIKITEFQIPTSEQFVEAVEDLLSKGCEKLVVDLRYNPGGELNSIVKTLNYIVPEGPIVHIKDADGNEVKTYYSNPDELDVPMAVLVNGSTASAAELFTSTVRDYNKAVIVGTTTYGKGCVQTTIELEHGGAVSVTYRMYDPPFSENYHGIGIIPDVEVELNEELQTKSVFKITDEEDNQLAAAVAALYDSAE